MASRNSNSDTIMEPEDLGFGVGMAGMVREAILLIRSHSRLFLALTLTLIMPLCIVGLGHNLITEPIAARIQWDSYFMNSIPRGSRGDGQASPSPTYQALDRDYHKELTLLLVALGVYLFATLAFSLLSTSAIVYSVACIYTNKTTTFANVLKVVPRVWRRLMVTFLWAILLYLAATFSFVVILVVITVLLLLIFSGSFIVTLVTWIATLAFISGLLYFSCVWHLASVVTVLENEQTYGLNAIKKAYFLIQGKLFIGLGLFLSYSILSFFISLIFEVHVVKTQWAESSSSTIVGRFFIGLTLILALSLLDLLGFLVQTIFYFACKAYHHESIDRLCLSEHLEAYLDGYMPLRGGNPPGSIQLESLDP